MLQLVLDAFQPETVGTLERNRQSLGLGMTGQAH